MLRHCGLAFLALALLGSPPVVAQTMSERIDLELNKLEQVENACRAYLVLRNATTSALDSLDLDLVTFQPDGVIGARFRIELAPVSADKTIVKSFDFEGVTCADIERVLLNDVVECLPLTRPVCLQELQLSSRNREFFK